MQVASPQRENGFTAIANEILEHTYSAKLTVTQLKIIMAIWRYTYGFREKQHNLSLSFLAKAIGTNRNFISRELSKLCEMKIINKILKTQQGQVLQFNKNYDEWVLSSRGVVQTDNCYPNRQQSVIQTDNRVLSKQITNKETSKEKLKENIYCAFFDSVWELYPNKKGKSKVNKNSIKDLQKLGFEKVKQSIDAYVLQKPDWQNWQNGSTFFNGGYLDYLGADAENQKEGAGKLPSDTEWQ